MSEQQDNQGRVIIPKEFAEQYSKLKGVSLDQAYKKLEENIRKENQGIDLALQYQTLIKAYRTMAPQLNGVVSRETDMANEIKALKNSVTRLSGNFERLQDQLELNKIVFRQAMDLLNNIVIEDAKTMARIAALESKLGGLKPSLWSKIKRIFWK